MNVIYICQDSPMPQIEIHTHVQRQGVTQRYEQTLALSHIRKLRDKNNATQAQTHTHTHIPNRCILEE